MKNLLNIKTICLSSLILFFITTSKAQYSLQTAVNSGFSSSGGGVYQRIDSLSPISSVVPAGPYYGNMTINTRPMWYYFPTCLSILSLYNEIELSNMSVSATAMCNVLIWGPFENFNTISLTDLDSSKLVSEKTVYISGGVIGGTTSSLTGIDSGKVYIIMFTTNDTIQTETLSMQIQIYPRFNFLGGAGPYPLYCNLCNGSPMYAEESYSFCSIGVDTPLNHVSMVWEKAASDKNIFGYVVKRKNVLNSYDSIGFVPYSSMSTFTDNFVNAVQQKYYYVIYAVDSCMNEYRHGNYEWRRSPVYLQTYPGLSNVNYLNWNWDSYFIENSIPIFYIWRASNGGAYQLIDSTGMSGGVPYMAYYTDISAPAGPTVYCIGVKQSIPCFPSKTGSVPGVSFSNPAGVVTLGIYDNLTGYNIRMFPTIARDEEITIDFSRDLLSAVNFSVYSTQGVLVRKSAINKDEKNFRFSSSGLSAGIYTVVIKGAESAKLFKFAVY